MPLHDSHPARKLGSGPCPRTGSNHGARPVCLVLALTTALLVLEGGPLPAQQIPDTAFVPAVAEPAYPQGAGPVVGLDVAHNNPSWDQGLRPLRTLLEVDGYRVGPVEGTLDRSVLNGIDILVIVDALADRNVENWTLPTPSSHGPEAREAIQAWVREGGSLLLVADHMPFAGAVGDLAQGFGIQVLNGFAVDTATWDPVMFRTADGSLARHPITVGERVDSVYTYWGLAMRDPTGHANPLMTYGPTVVSFQPERAWRFDEPGTEVRSVAGWQAGLAMEFGEGRVVFLGDSGMLSAYLSGPQRTPTGMNAPAAGQNGLFLSNLFRWLAASPQVGGEGGEPTPGDRR